MDSLTNKKTKERIACYFSLEQTSEAGESQESYLNIMTILADFLGTRVIITKHYDPVVEYYRIRTANVNSNHLLINYLDMFSLLSSKRLDYLDWKKVCHFITLKRSS